MMAFIETIRHELPGVEEMLDETDEDVSCDDPKGLVESVEEMELESEDEGDDE